MRKAGMLVLFVATLFVVATQPAPGQPELRQKEQTHFSAEDENVNHPVAIPAEVLALLAKDSQVRDVLDDQNIAPANLPASWFSAAEIQLGGKGERDLIVGSK